jgi:hypothetical protein
MSPSADVCVEFRQEEDGTWVLLLQQGGHSWPPTQEIA